jgi:hypothetical protein
MLRNHAHSNTARATSQKLPHYLQTSLLTLSSKLLRLRVWIYMSMYACNYVCMYGCMYVCMYVRGYYVSVYVLLDCIHKVPIILHDKIQHESHKQDGPSTSVT